MFESQKKSGTIKRLALASGKKTRSTSSTADFFLQPLGTEDSAVYEGNFSLAVKMYCDKSVDVQKTDEIIIDGQSYNVTSVLDYDFGNYPHKKIFAERPSDD